MTINQIILLRKLTMTTPYNFFPAIEGINNVLLADQGVLGLLNILNASELYVPSF